MKLASIFIYEPCISWKPRDRHEYSYNFSCSDAFAEEVCIKENMVLVSKEVECLGGAVVVHLEMKSNYSVNHPEANQAHYQAIAVLFY